MKKKKRISFRLVAFTDAAGKFSPEAFRSGNEDNFYVAEDIASPQRARMAGDEPIPLGPKGMVMVVADGMGGMNAGEVASQIAVDTVKDAFASDSLSEEVCQSAQSRTKYLEQVIRAADKGVKVEARRDKSKEGMGSTIIIGWLYNDELTVSWCGDSRAYIFNPQSGIRLISRDHSYVQELVNRGMLTYDQSFNHPQGNIVTRSLGDPQSDAKPESRTVSVGKGDIILLCSDGLSGVLRDRKTYDENGRLCPEANMEDIIRAHSDSMRECREALWEAAEKGGWSDNVTAVLCQITDGPESRWSEEMAPENKSPRKGSGRGWKTLCWLLVTIVIAAFAYFLGRYGWPANPRATMENESISEISVEAKAVDPNISAEETPSPENAIDPISITEEEVQQPHVAENRKKETAEPTDSEKPKTPKEEKINSQKDDKSSASKNKEIKEAESGGSELTVIPPKTGGNEKIGNIWANPNNKVKKGETPLKND